MAQLSLGIEYLMILALNDSWREIWRRYELMRRSQLNQRDSLLARLQAKWLSVDEYVRCIIPIVAVNTLVLLLWASPRCAHKMNRYFICRPNQFSNLSLCLSTFSHQQFWHFACNMIALFSFGRLAYEKLGCEQFYAFYLSAGLFSSYLSYLFKFLIGATSIGSLGASGAVYAVMALVVKEYPDISVSLIFLPFIPFSGRKNWRGK
ncbi:presenilins-associated rhomboid-like mitochondrial [Blastocystis sp. subtype 4]|uniref:presenilins-associated rhomboid-like mitochondrial n=1 Tax=Blastocystis sp. subtype 4 TaxID=944170 RepID=UPI0007121133|nr:presenilins-associated rhomboid-like mitochondrial [Blastocystis sp. subtype 4]KNB42037.1 presenilins-associated rhomboid-like mitochondrial [Blastocystis sp. subtype 4]|eukprot:XP_014525480.1 presenilins-associated rhomboid-like mitochondrial [Blastocystis sp. subtype 4]